MENAERINSLQGKHMLQEGRSTYPVTMPLEALRKLIMLCHVDTSVTAYSCAKVFRQNLTESQCRDLKAARKRFMLPLHPPEALTSSAHLFYHVDPTLYEFNNQTDDYFTGKKHDVSRCKSCEF